MKSRIVGLALALALLVPRFAFAVAWVMPSGNNPGSTAATVTGTGALINGGGSFIGSVLISPIGTPSAPSMTTNGTAGVTSLVYACTAFDFNGNQTIPSATATITTANATLSATNSVNVTCPAQKGAAGFLINKVDTAHIIGFCYSNYNSPCTFIDTGTYSNGNGGATQSSSFTTTAQTVDQTGSITSGLITTANSALQEATAGTQLTTGTTQNQTAFTVTGATANMGCECNLSVLPPATWQTGVVLGCAMTANTLTPFITNPTAGSITPTAQNINCRVFP